MSNKQNIRPINVENYTVSRYELSNGYFMEIVTIPENEKTYFESWLCGEYTKRMIQEEYFNGNIEEFAVESLENIDIDIETFEYYEKIVMADEGFSDEDDED